MPYEVIHMTHLYQVRSLPFVARDLLARKPSHRGTFPPTAGWTGRGLPVSDHRLSAYLLCDMNLKLSVFHLPFCKMSTMLCALTTS